MTRCAVLALLLCAGCDQVFGLTGGGTSDAALDGQKPVDAASGDAIQPCADGIGHDEDLDSIDDACDVCPATPDTSQQDTDSDGIGDACDPRTQQKDRRVAFFGFGGKTVPGDLRTVGTWSVSADRLIIAGSDATADYIALAQILEPSIEVHTRAHLLSIGAPVQSEAQALGVWANVDSGSTSGFPFGTVLEMNLYNGAPTFHVVDRHSTSMGSQGGSGLMQMGAVYDIDLQCGPLVPGCKGRLDLPALDPASGIPSYITGGAGLRARGNVTVAFDFLDLIAIGTE